MDLTDVEIQEGRFVWSGASEAIQSVAYTPLTGDVEIYFTSGHGPYMTETSARMWEQFLASGSKGAFVNRYWLK